MKKGIKKCLSGQHIRLDGKNPKCNCEKNQMNNLNKIEELPEEIKQKLVEIVAGIVIQEKEKWQRELTTKIQKLKGIDKSVLEEILNLLKEI